MEITRPVRLVSSSFDEDTKLVVEMDNVPRVGEHLYIASRKESINGAYEVVQIIHRIDGSDYQGPVVEVEPSHISLP